VFGWIVIIAVTALIVVGTLAKFVQIVSGRAWCRFCRRTLQSGATTCPTCDRTQPWAEASREASRLTPKAFGRCKDGGGQQRTTANTALS
jgi:hypothetical protein